MADSERHASCCVHSLLDKCCYCKRTDVRYKLRFVDVPYVLLTDLFVVAAVNVVGVCFPGGLFSKTEMSEVLTEIVKADPSFDKDNFLKQCEKDIIPNILEVPYHMTVC